MTTIDRQGQKAIVRTITPEMASAMIERSEKVNQRTLRTGRAEAYGATMKAGEWRLNGETVIVAHTGEVINGQHRLWGCIMAGAPFTTWIIEGVDPEEFKTIDTGKSRDGADMATISARREGVEKLSGSASRAAACAARLLSMTRNGRYVQESNNGGVRTAMSNQVVADYFAEHPDLLGDAAMFQSWGKWPLSLGVALWVHSQTKAAFPDSLDEFWRPLQSGENLHRSSPLLMLRKKAGFGGSDRAADFRAERDVMAQLVKVWNMYAIGWQTEIKALRYAAGVEAFPTLALKPGERPKHIKDVRVGRKLEVVKSR